MRKLRICAWPGCTVGSRERYFRLCKLHEREAARYRAHLPAQGEHAKLVEKGALARLKMAVAMLKGVFR